jgi:hypothetical protein
VKEFQGPHGAMDATLGTNGLYNNLNKEDRMLNSTRVKPETRKLKGVLVLFWFWLWFYLFIYF